MVYVFLKRSLDLIGALSCLILLSPIILLVGLLIRLSSGSPILVEESNRIGRNGRLFRMYKFRSMIQNSHKIIRTDPKFKKLLNDYKSNSFKLSSDPRVTPVGRFLRRFSLDELPQLFNVLKGDMSLIGPRAYYPDELEEQKKNFPQCKNMIETALSVRPGITGLWQVSGRSRIGFEQRIKMDSDYAKSKNIFLDFLIIVRTPWAILAGEGV